MVGGVPHFDFHWKAQKPRRHGFDYAAVARVRVLVMMIQLDPWVWPATVVSIVVLLAVAAAAAEEEVVVPVWDRPAHCTTPEIVPHSHRHAAAVGTRRVRLTLMLCAEATYSTESLTSCCFVHTLTVRRVALVVVVGAVAADVTKSLA